MSTRTKNDASSEAPNEEKLGAGVGVLAGGALGAVGGPIGMAVGASLGALVGEAAGDALHERKVEAAKHHRDAAAFLRADHDKLEQLASTVLDSVVAGDRAEVGDAIEAMQTGVLAHLAGEERDVIPGYAEHAPEDAKALLDEHAAIREALAEFSMETDLHLLRADAVKAFLARLRAHAEREDAGLYRWALE